MSAHLAGAPDPTTVDSSGGPRPTVDDEERYARAWLSRSAEPGDRRLWAFVETYGAPATMRALRSGQAPEPLRALAGERATEDRTEQDLDLARRRGIRLVVPGDPEWPIQQLRPMYHAAGSGSTSLVPPLALWVRGSGPIAEAVASAVAMVGSRAATEYGVTVTGNLAYALANRGWTVISGGAFGIDAAAHRAALAAGGRTVAVLAGGLDKAYPPGNAALFERISETGLLISEWPPGCAPMRRRFLIRNRVVAGLAAGAIVVEAAARSGAQSTAARTRELGQPLMVVPGSVLSAMSVGCLALLRTGGVRPVGTVEHVLEEIGRIGDDLAPPEPGPVDTRDDLDPTQRAVLDAVPVRRPVPPERIAVAAGVAVADVLRALPALELSDLVELTDRGWRLGPAARRQP